MPASPSPSSGSTSRSLPSPPGKRVAATSSKCAATAAKVSANRRSTVSASSARRVLQLLQAQLEILSLRVQLRQPLGFGLVLLLRERVHLTELDAARVQPLDPRGELLAIVALGRLGGRFLAAPARVCRVGLDPRQLDLDPGRALRRLFRRPAQIDLRRAEFAQPAAEVGRARGTRVDTGTQRRVEARGGGRSERQRVVEPLRACRDAVDVDRRRPWSASRRPRRPPQPRDPHRLRPRLRRRQHARPPRSARAPRAPRPRAPLLPPRAPATVLRRPGAPWRARPRRRARSPAPQLPAPRALERPPAPALRRGRPPARRCPPPGLAAAARSAR